MNHSYYDSPEKVIRNRITGYIQTGANTVITLDASDAITLTNVTASSLTSAQFNFA